MARMVRAAPYLCCACSCRTRFLLCFGISDDATTDPRQDFAVRLNWRWGRTRRPGAEFLFVLVGGPSGLVVASRRDERKHGMPAHPFMRIGRLDRTTITINASEFAIGKDDGIGTPLWQKAAMRTCFAAGT